MFTWTIWVIYQLVTTVGFFVWYAKKHPVEAREMVDYWSMLVPRIARAIRRRWSNFL